MERKHLNEWNAAPESLSCVAQEEREGGIERGRRKIERETPEMEGMGQHTENNKWDMSTSTAEERPQKK